ncbi:MAG: O-antigen ligase family protein [Brasilonema octagenarum HA4186-MV1]|nr:O-antigen ligase family protein [Brasilonema octagenarum HA4186-MV1]
MSSIEAGIVILLLLSGEVLNVPPFLTTIINLLSYVAVILLVLWRFKHIVYVLTQEKVLLLLVGVAFASIFWSVNTFETFKQIRALARTTIFGVYLATRYTIKQQMNLLSWTIALIAILTTFVCIVNPSYGISITNHVATWQGIYAHKQYLGRQMSLGASLFLVTIFDKQNNRWLKITLLILTLVLILLSTSKTSLIVFLVTILLLPLYKVAKQQYAVRVIMIFTILVISFSVISVFVSNLETILVDILGKDIEFNGRTPIWTLAIEKVLERPWLGYGYAAFWKSDGGYYIIKNTWAALIEEATTLGFNSHNGYLDLTLNIGLVGLLILVIDIFIFIYRIIKLLIFTKTIESFWMLVFIANVLIVNSSEAITFLSPSGIFWMIHVSLAFSAALECSRIRKNPYLSSLLDKPKMTS